MQLAIHSSEQIKTRVQSQAPATCLTLRLPQPTLQRFAFFRHDSYRTTVSIAEIKKLSLQEKLDFMEALWNDLRSYPDQVPMPQWQKDLLDTRRSSVEKGEDKLIDWDDVKASWDRRFP